jgi:hypothetical protein
MNQQQSMKVCLAAIIVILAIASVLVCAHAYRGGQYSNAGPTQAPPGKSNTDKTQAPPGQTETELYQEMLITALDPYIQKSVMGYYNSQYVLAPPYVVKVMAVTRPTAEQVYEFSIEVEPYIGSHYPVGIDHITIRISPTGIDVVNFEHIKSFPLPPDLQSLIQR